MKAGLCLMTVCLFFALILVPDMAECKGKIDEGTDSFAISTERLGFRIMKTTGRLPSGGGIYVFDGKSKKDLVPEHVYRIDKSPNSLRIIWDVPVDAPAVECEVNAQERHISFVLQFANNTKDERWAEGQLRFFLKLPEPRSFWDGYELHENPTEEKVRNKLPGLFPMCCAYNGKQSLALGIEPQQYLSYLETRFSPASDKLELRLTTRIVMDPGTTEKVAFVVYAFDGEAGYNSALATYYDLFPDMFRPLPNVDRRVSDNGATYNAWANDPQPEICRRFYTGWEWCYAPFKRTGDWLCKKEFWDYEPARELSGVRKKTLEEFHEWRSNRMLNGRLCDVAMLFYIPSCIWCEKRLAQDVYADALIGDRDVKTYFDTPWVTGHDNELRVYPWGNKFGDVCVDDMKKITEALDIAGFAFDTATGGAKYRGPGVKNSPGRAWDEEGVYCDEAMAIGKLMDFVHSLQKNGRPLAVVSNAGASPVYISTFKSDSAMFEGTPWRPRRVVQPVHLRRFLGKKTMVWWEDFLLERVAQWEEMTPEQICDAYLGLADYVILKSAQIGGLPTPRLSLGVPKIVKQLPALLELVHAGWEPVTAVTADERLWIGRFGQSVNTLISIGNATLDSATYPIAIENSNLGKCGYLFTTYDGGKVKLTIEEGKTKTELAMKPRELVILRGQIGIHPPTPLTGTVSAKESAESCKLTAGLETQQRGKVRFICRIPQDFRPASVTVNDESVEPMILKGKLNFDAELAGRTAVSVVFASQTFDSPEEALLKFPFVKDEKPNCEIVIPDYASDVEKYVAERIQLYFKFYYERAKSKVGVEIPMRKASELKGNEKYLVLVDATDGEELIQKVTGGSIRGEERDKCVKLAKDGTVLCISARTLVGVHDATFSLLRALDKKYPYYGGFPQSEAAAKAGIVGKVLQ